MSIVTCNEAEELALCLHSLDGLADDVVVIDLASHDDSRAVAAAHGARVVAHTAVPYVELVRQLGIDAADGPWVLLLDPDEQLGPGLGPILREVAEADEHDVVEIPRLTRNFGRLLTAPGFDDHPQVRFFRKGCLQWPTDVHGRPSVEGLRVLRLQTADWMAQGLYLMHDSWRSPHQVLDKFSRYTGSHARQVAAAGTAQPTARRLLGGPVLSFGEQFLRARGYEDGLAGLLTALYASVYDMTVNAELLVAADGSRNTVDATIVRWGKRSRPVYLALNRSRRRARRLIRELWRRMTWTSAS